MEGSGSGAHRLLYQPWLVLCCAHRLLYQPWLVLCSAHRLLYQPWLVLCSALGLQAQPLKVLGAKHIQIAMFGAMLTPIARVELDFSLSSFVSIARGMMMTSVPRPEKAII